MLKSYSGSLGQRGSSQSDQNHSSFISQFGSGFVDDPGKQVEQMVGRQNSLNKKRWNNCHVYLQKCNGRASGSHRKRHYNWRCPLSSFVMGLWTMEKPFQGGLKVSLHHSWDGVQHSMHRFWGSSKLDPKEWWPLLVQYPCCLAVPMLTQDLCRPIPFDLTLISKRRHKRSALTSSYAVGNPITNNDVLESATFDNDNGSNGDYNQVKMGGNRGQFFQETQDEHSPTEQSQQGRNQSRGQEYNKLVTIVRNCCKLQPVPNTAIFLAELSFKWPKQFKDRPMSMLATAHQHPLKRCLVALLQHTVYLQWETENCTWHHTWNTQHAIATARKTANSETSRKCWNIQGPNIDESI